MCRGRGWSINRKREGGEEEEEVEKDKKGGKNIGQNTSRKGERTMFRTTRKESKLREI